MFREWLVFDFVFSTTTAWDFVYAVFKYIFLTG